MEDCMVCAICREAFSREREPLVLQCGHSFCRYCIEHLVNENSYMKCSFDRSYDMRPIGDFRPNIALLQLIEYKSKPRNWQKCSIHRFKNSRFLCFTCKQFFCSSCITTHSFHNWIDLKNPQDLQSYLNTKLQSLQKSNLIFAQAFKDYQNLMLFSVHLETQVKERVNLKAEQMKSRIDREKIEFLGIFNDEIGKTNCECQSEIKKLQVEVRRADEFDRVFMGNDVVTNLQDEGGSNWDTSLENAEGAKRCMERYAEALKKIENKYLGLIDNF